MTPYLRAHRAYHALGEQDIPWTVAVDFHLQHGTVISTPDVFVMARPVPPGTPPDLETGVNPLPYEGPAARWHVWALAGSLRAALWEAALRGVCRVSFQRRGSQELRELDLSRFHALPEVSAPRPAAGLGHLRRDRP